MNSKLILGGTMLIAISLILLISGGVKTSETDKKSMQDAQTDIEITIYEGLGLVKEIRDVNFSKGVNSVKFMDVPSQIDPTSLRIKDLSNKAYIIEQNYDYDLISLDKLLQKYLDKNVTFVLENRTIAGKLLVASSRNPILETDEGIIVINEPIKNIKFSGIPEGLATKPTLNVLMESKTAGKRSIELNYLTNGMTWYSNYVCVLDKNDKKTDLNGWITIDNQAGTTYKDAKLKVVAGDIHRVRKEGMIVYHDTVLVKGVGMPEVKEEILFEYHMYTIPTKTTLKNNQQKQISFMNAYDVNCDKIFVYDPQSSSKVNVKVKFKNSKNNNLGIPLPKGKVRLYKEDSEGKLQFLGEDHIDHTPEDEDVFLYVGGAFDVVAEKTEIDRKDGYCERDVEYKVNIRNHKKENIEVYVIERPYYAGNWEILKENFKHHKESTTKISWNIKIKANGNETLTYRILYRNPRCR